jgi:hypothetical protein
MVKIGSQLGVKSKSILEVLKNKGHMNRLDLERLLAIAPLTVPLNNLSAHRYIIRHTAGVASGTYSITRLGRAAMGEALELKAPAVTRICNGTMKGTYNPLVDGVSRVGLARV